MKKITSQTSFIFTLILSLLVFWLGGKGDAMLYSIAFFYLIIPVSTLISSVARSMKHSFCSSIILALCHGLSFMMVEYLTFSLANMIAFDHINLPNFEFGLSGIAISIIGALIGKIICRVRGRS